jgi:hypothetical protein
MTVPRLRLAGKSVERDVTRTSERIAHVHVPIA